MSLPFSRLSKRIMAFHAATPIPAPSSAAGQASSGLLRIAPQRGWLDLRLREVWRFRELLGFLVWRDVSVRYKQTAIGIAWVILQPLAAMAVFTLFFGRLAKLPSDGLPYPVFYFAALLPWTYFSGALQSAAAIVVENQRVITRVYFPRLILPLSAVLSGLVDFSVGFCVLALVTLAHGFRPGLHLLWLPALLFLAVAASFAMGLWLSALNALYRDVRFVMPFLVQFWMLASPVAYPASLVPQPWRWLYGLNPMTGVIEGFRWALTGQGSAPGMLVLVSAAMVALALLGGLLFFQRVEGTLADLV